jgi:hypothetical protein
MPLIPTANRFRNGIWNGHARKYSFSHKTRKNLKWKFILASRGEFLECIKERLRPGTHYPHVTWTHVMLRVQLGSERRFDIEFYGADSHFCHSAYVKWSHVELWSAHVPARLSYFCCRTHFVRRDGFWGDPDLISALPTYTRHGHRHRVTVTRDCIDAICLSWWWARCGRNM